MSNFYSIIHLFALNTDLQICGEYAVYEFKRITFVHCPFNTSNIKLICELLSAAKNHLDLCHSNWKWMNVVIICCRQKSLWDRSSLWSIIVYKNTTFCAASLWFETQQTHFVFWFILVSDVQEVRSSSVQSKERRDQLKLKFVNTHSQLHKVL